MKPLNLLFDGNYLIHKTFGVWSTYYMDKKKTAEENEQAVAEALRDKEKQQVLVRKIVIDLCYAVQRFNDVKRVAVVIDSHSWRYNFYDDYKYGLTRVRASYYDDFCKMIDYIEEFLRNKGLIVSRVHGAEGDDLLYIWSIYFSQILDERLVIITGDSDIRQIIDENVSLFNNNSKILKFYCVKSNEVYWNEYFDTDVFVEAVVPFEVLLYKVIMGDTSDNIPKLKKGFGPAAFQKFITAITPYKQPEPLTVVDTAQWIAKRFSDFAKVAYEEVLGQVIFNLQMTWLNLAVYNDTNCMKRNGKNLLENMLDDVNKNKNKYKYNKEYSLEEFYGLPIK